MIRRPPRSTLSSSSAASDVYKRQQYSSLSGDELRTAELFQICEDKVHLPPAFVVRLRTSDAKGQYGLSQFRSQKPGTVSVIETWTHHTCTALALLSPMPIRDKAWLCFSFFQASAFNGSEVTWKAWSASTLAGQQRMAESSKLSCSAVECLIRAILTLSPHPEELKESVLRSAMHKVAMAAYPNGRDLLADDGIECSFAH
eukprot:TRINITY_DN43931_c0_g2_i1.p1 TRINITY_DN43931_c0_g2~~TRINITY_DN43931_c0_g2_i1.p1  ORF type:complete len:201 (-),score=59.08 TRINITY_DN43931_c0_g2_i1:481-1083(-)